MYGSGSRPDIYLDIYRTVHTSAAEDGIETELIYPSYRWTNEGLLPPETEAPSEGAGDPAGEEPGTASGEDVYKRQIPISQDCGPKAGGTVCVPPV